MDKTRYITRFNRKKRLNKDGLAALQIECYLNGKRRFFDTKIRLKPAEWDNKNNEVKPGKHPNATQLNRHIKDFIRELETYELQRLNDNRPFTLNMLDNVFKKKNISTFNEFMSLEIKNSTLSNGTIKSHTTTLKRLNEFKSQIYFNDLDFEFLHDLERYFKGLTIEQKNGSFKKLSHNTIWKYFKNIKVYVNLAIDKGFLSVEQYPFRKFKFTSKAGKRVYLTPDEIKQFQDVQTNGKLQYIKDLFLFSCYTGLRYSDVMSLKKSDIVLKNGSEWIIKEMDKTKETVRIPVYALFNNEPLKIVTKYRALERFNIFPYITNQFLNRELKKLAKKANIHKNITFHAARHTTATYLLYKNVPVTTVQKILGHKKLSTTQIYGHIIDKTIDNDINAVNF